MWRCLYTAKLASTHTVDQLQLVGDRTSKRIRANLFLFLSSFSLASCNRSGRLNSSFTQLQRIYIQVHRVGFSLSVRRCCFLLFLFWMNFAFFSLSAFQAKFGVERFSAVNFLPFKFDQITEIEEAPFMALLFRFSDSLLFLTLRHQWSVFQSKNLSFELWSFLIVIIFSKFCLEKHQIVRK